MAQQIPLNNFRLIAEILPAGNTVLYTEEIEATCIILNTTVSNVSTDVQQFTLKVKKAGTSQPVVVLKNFRVPPEETVVPVGGEGKLILEKLDELIYETDTPDVLHVTLSILENAND